MSDYLRSALGYLNAGTSSNEYVGQVIEINNVKLRVNRLLAEGGWAFVFAVEDLATGKEYALKRLIANTEEANKNIVQEIETLKKLSGHSNIIQYYHAQRLERDNPKGYEYLLVMELCTGGTVADILRNIPANSLSLAQVCRIAYQATKGVHHMHNHPGQPIVHRDIKLENFLIGGDGLVKLCDFGSASTQFITPDPSWNANKRSLLEDQMAKYTTPMYRAPEMMDTWNNEPIGLPVDCWALGCIFYALVTQRHPFPEGNKLAVLNAKYPPLPPNPKLACFNDLINGCLKPSPGQRMTTSILLERLAAIAESNNFDPREPPKVEVKQSPPPRPAPPPPPQQTSAAVPPPRPGPPQNVPPPKPPAPQPARPAQPAQSASLFSSLRGNSGGFSGFLRNIKDTSSKVMHTVQQSMARTELDASYVTSRILVMPYPADGIEAAYRSNHVEDVSVFLLSRHKNPIRIHLFNLARGKPNINRLPGKNINCTFAYAVPDSPAPTLEAVYQICQELYQFLRESPDKHFAVLYCSDGLHGSALISCALFLYSKALSTKEEVITLFKTRRCQSPQFSSAELRILDYMSRISRDIHPHSVSLVLHSITIQPVPLFTRARDGCRPYVDVYSGGALVCTTRNPDYYAIKLYNVTENKVTVQLFDVAVRGDITVVVFHARQQLGRVIGIKIASIYFHSGFVPVEETSIVFNKNEMDDAPEVGGSFKAALSFNFANFRDDKSSNNQKNHAYPWESKPPYEPSPSVLFDSTLEMEETLENFRKSPSEMIQATLESSPQERFSEESVPLRDEEENEPILEQNAPEAGNLLEADLLNLGSSPEPNVNSNNNVPKPSVDSFTSSNQNENDIFGSFTAFNQQAPPPAPASTPSVNPSNGTNDFLFGGNNRNANVNDILFDPLGGWNATKGQDPSLRPEENIPRNASTPNFAAQNKDPFANLADSFVSGLTSSWNGTQQEPPNSQSTTPLAGTPTHSSPRTSKPTATSNENVDTTTSAKTAKPADAFEDLLGSQGYNFSSRKAEKESPKTMNQMRKLEVAKTTDPDKLKVEEWTEGKKGNLRALLCSMHTVLWPEEDRWQRCEMHQLVSAADVKKSYRKACLAVHPDKQAGTENENIAKLIFMELNNAWSTFENDAAQQNLFS